MQHMAIFLPFEQKIVYALQFILKAIHKQCQYQRCWCLIFTSATLFATENYMCDACYLCFPPFGVAYSIWGNLGCSQYQVSPPWEPRCKAFRQAKQEQNRRTYDTCWCTCLQFMANAPVPVFYHTHGRKMACLWGRSHPSLTAQWMNRRDQGKRQLRPRNVGTLGKGGLLSEHTMTPSTLEDSCETTG